ncbi:hypothetical protein V5799_021814 [Amblyomma americanum]|uniref:Uncharacterized protein n=1 Tax=Amblyomma americanum TaxID=6943 RepID=A0AAQ4FMD0_AMBAM
MAHSPPLLLAFRNKTAHFVKTRPTLVKTVSQNCRRHVDRFAEAIAKADALLGRTGDPVLEDLLATFAPGDTERLTLETAVRSSPISRILLARKQSSYREVGTLAHLFTRIRKKGAPKSDAAELARTNQRRLVSIAQMQQMAQDVHDTVVTTVAGDIEAVTAANKLAVLLGNALFALAVKTVTDMRDSRLLPLYLLSLERFSSSFFDQEDGRSSLQWLSPREQWCRHQARTTEPLANAFECSLLLAGGAAEECAAARRCGTDLALAMQIRREQRYVAGEVSSVIRELADGVLAYAADCEMSDDLAAFQDIAASLKDT